MSRRVPFGKNIQVCIYTSNTIRHLLVSNGWTEGISMLLCENIHHQDCWAYRCRHMWPETFVTSDQFFKL